MGQLVNLDGVAAKAVDCEFIGKSYKIPEILKKGLAATAAGDNGSLNIYKDDEGNIRCQAHKFMMTVDSQKFSKMKDVKDWADKWLKKIDNN